MLSKHVRRSGLHAWKRCISTGEAAVTQPLHFLGGKRVNPTNPNESHDFRVIEPSTGGSLQWRILDFPLGRGVGTDGGADISTWLLFGKFVCEKKELDPLMH